LAAAEKSESESEGGQKFLMGMTLKPPSFLPARAFSFSSAELRSVISQDFVQNEF